MISGIDCSVAVGRAPRPEAGARRLPQGLARGRHALRLEARPAGPQPPPPRHLGRRAAGAWHRLARPHRPRLGGRHDPGRRPADLRGARGVRAWGDLGTDASRPQRPPAPEAAKAAAQDDGLQDPHGDQPPCPSRTGSAQDDTPVPVLDPPSVRRPARGRRPPPELTQTERDCSLPDPHVRDVPLRQGPAGRLWGWRRARRPATGFACR